MSVKTEAWRDLDRGGGVYAGKPRPVLVIQDDHFAGTDSVTVIPMTTTALDVPLLRIPVEPTPATGLGQPTLIMIDKVTTTRRFSVQKRVGTLAAADLVRRRTSLLVFLGMGARRPLRESSPHRPGQHSQPRMTADATRQRRGDVGNPLGDGRANVVDEGGRPRLAARPGRVPTRHRGHDTQLTARGAPPMYSCPARRTSTTGRRRVPT
jgi:mRNA interferase MazF